MTKELKIWSLFVGIGISTMTLLWLLSRKKTKTTAFKTKLVNIANVEHEAWGFGKIKEGSQDTIQRLRNYWEQGAGIKANDNFYVNEAWSSAFISYLMKKAGAGDEFKYNASHSQYITEAIKNRKENNSKKFKGYKPNEVKVEVGDLVCYPRQKGVTYDSKAGYLSHCDLIVAVKEDRAIGVGGNISNSVNKKNYPLKNGKIDKSRDTLNYGGVFVVIKNKK